MATFVIIGNTGLDRLGKKVKALYPEDRHYELSPAAWFVRDSATVTEIARKLELYDGELGAQAVVVRVASSAGYAPGDIWEWMQIKEETKPNG